MGVCILIQDAYHLRNFLSPSPGDMIQFHYGPPYTETGFDEIYIYIKYEFNTVANEHHHTLYHLSEKECIRWSGMLWSKTNDFRRHFWKVVK